MSIGPAREAKSTPDVFNMERASSWRWAFTEKPE
jgi:hypothetical protein